MPLEGMRRVAALERVPNGDGSRLQVDIDPSKCEELALPQPEAQGSDMQRLEAITPQLPLHEPEDRRSC